MSLDNNLKKLIEQNKLKITELSDETGVDRSTIHKLINGENKNPKIKTVEAIAKYFNVTIDEFIK